MGDLDRELVLAVYGQAAPKGSMKCIGSRGKGGHQLIEDSKRTKPWRDRVAGAARTLPLSGLSGPLGIEVTFTLDRPESHYAPRRNSLTLRSAAPPCPSRRASRGIGGDVDKLARTILDALEDSGLLVDDAQIVELIARKTYAHGPIVLPDALDRPGARIRVYPIGAAL